MHNGLPTRSLDVEYKGTAINDLGKGRGNQEKKELEPLLQGKYPLQFWLLLLQLGLIARDSTPIWVILGDPDVTLAPS